MLFGCLGIFLFKRRQAFFSVLSIIVLNRFHRVAIAIITHGAFLAASEIIAFRMNICTDRTT